jgi:putative methionine-R-sulfoxide reductase with GAF domain
MRIDPAALVKSIGDLESFDLAEGLAASVELLVTMTKDLLDADGAGLMLVDADGQLRWASASDQPAQEVEQDQQELAQGPCAQAFSQAAPVAWRDVDRDGLGEIVSALLQARYKAGVSVPVELGGGPIGTLDVYARTPRAWHHSEISALQAYAGVLATLLGAAVTAEAKGRLARQLQVALDHRILIEQAKGVLMERDGIDPPTAFDRLRNAARSTRVKMVEVANDVLAGKPLPSGRVPVKGTVEVGHAAEPAAATTEAQAEAQAEVEAEVGVGATALQQAAELHEQIAELYEQQGRGDQARRERQRAAQARRRLQQTTGGQQPLLP